MATHQYKGQPSSQEVLDRRRLSLVVLVQSVDLFRTALDDMGKHRAVEMLRDSWHQNSKVCLFVIAYLALLGDLLDYVVSQHMCVCVKCQTGC